MEQALIEAGVKKPATITHLTITGELTSSDIFYIARIGENTLQKLDLSGTTVTENMLGHKPAYTFFNLCKLTSVILPDSLVKIGHSAFVNCGLISVTIPRSVVEISRDSFSNCKSLTSIHVHPDNPAYTSEDGIVFNKDKTALILYPQGRQIFIKKTYSNKSGIALPKFPLLEGINSEIESRTNDVAFEKKLERFKTIYKV